MAYQEKAQIKRLRYDSFSVNPGAFSMSICLIVWNAVGICGGEILKLVSRGGLNSLRTIGPVGGAYFTMLILYQFVSYHILMTMASNQKIAHGELERLDQTQCLINRAPNR